LVTQFREEVKYCRDEKKKQCFAKPLKEGCGESAKELRQSKTGLACTTEKGKCCTKQGIGAILHWANVLLILTSDSDNCAVVGVKKDKIQEGANVVTDWVQADLNINLPARLEADQGSVADLLGESCGNRQLTDAALLKFCAWYASLIWKVIQLTKVIWKVAKNKKKWAGCSFVVGQCLIGLVWTIWALTSAGCAQFRTILWFELITIILGLIIIVCDQIMKVTRNDIGKKSRFEMGGEILMILVACVAICSDILGFVEAKTCAIQGLQIAVVALNVLSLCARIYICLRYCCSDDDD
jgi:hypothetical protein